MTASSDPSDLIRAATEALDGITPGPWEVQHRAEKDWLSRSPHVSSEDHEAGSTVRPTGAVDPTWGSIWPHRGATADADFFAAAPDLVRRLRDALITAQNNFHREAALAEANATIAEREAERDEARKGVEQTMQLLFDTRARLDGLKAELAESNAAIEMAKAMGAITGPLYTHALNQALKGEQP